jgi:hypothetical protein
MSTANIVVNVPDRQVHRIVFVIACSDRNSSLITPQDDGDKHRSIGLFIFADNVLDPMSVLSSQNIEVKYVPLDSKPSSQT